MEAGLMFYVPVRRSQEFEATIRKLAELYEAKFDVRPDCCHVHPWTLLSCEVESVDGIRLVADTSILPNHFWIGVELEAETIQT